MASGSNPGWFPGYIPSAAEWNTVFGGKLDVTDPIATSGPYMPLAGGSMSGALTLSGDPTTALQAATRQYTDGAVTRAGGPFLPLTGGTLTGALSGPTFNNLAVTQPATGATLTVADGKTFTVNRTMALTGTDGTTMTFPNVNATIPGLALGNVFTVRQFFQGSATSGTNTGVADVSVNGGATSTRAFSIQAAGVARWQLSGINNSLSGNNQDTDFSIGSFTDAGAFNTFFLKVKRASGPLGLGPPVAYDAGPIVLSHTAAVTAGGSVGHRAVIDDQQPVYPLAANPISTVSGSPTVTVALPNAGAMLATAPASWVNLLGATAVGGITPTGWLRVQSIAANSFTVNWTSNATSTAGPGGGSAVTIQPSFPMGMMQNQFTQKSGAQGFNLMHSNIYNADPAFRPLRGDGSAGNSGWSMYWNVAASPSDAAGTYQCSILGEEMDILWRGPDDGYEPRAALGVRSLGVLAGPLWTVPNYITDGGVGGAGTPNHVNTMWTLFGNQGFPGTYVAFSIQPNALVGKGIDTVTNHGGVGLDLFGSYSLLQGAVNPFTTAAGTSTITVKTVPTAQGPGQLRKQVNGGTVYIPGTYTISGVTFGGGSYTIGNVDDVAGSFTITGTGTAAASVAGGGTRVVIYFTNLSPYAGMQLNGLWEDGIYSHPTLSRFTSGLIVHTQPGVGMGWDDGTAIASISSSAISAGNLNVDITPAGTGSVIVHGSITGPNLPRVIATAGQASVTGTTTETNLGVLRIPAGTMGRNGVVEVTAFYSYTNSSNNKTMIPRWTSASGSTAGGVMTVSVAVTTSATTQHKFIIRNNNAANSQLFYAGGGTSPFGSSVQASMTGAIDTATVDAYVNLNGLLAVGTDTITLLHAYAVIFPSSP